MEFRVADSFVESLAQLTSEERRSTRNAAVGLHSNLAQPGFQMHRVQKAKDQNFWSVRVNRELRIIVHRITGCAILCYVGHHDDAYMWAERHRVADRDGTGDIELIDIRDDIVECAESQSYDRIAASAESIQLFGGVSDDVLLACGLRSEQVERVRQISTEDSLLDFAIQLPSEVADSLVNVVLGIHPSIQPATRPPAITPPTVPGEPPRMPPIHTSVIGSIRDLALLFMEKWIAGLEDFTNWSDNINRRLNKKSEELAQRLLDRIAKQENRNKAHAKLLADAPRCPTHNCEMLMKAHGPFWGCPEFPNCRFTITLTPEQQRLLDESR